MRRDEQVVNLKIPPLVQITLADGRAARLAATPAAFLRFQRRKGDDPLTMFASGQPKLTDIVALLYDMLIEPQISEEEWERLLPLDLHGYVEIIRRALGIEDGMGELTPPAVSLSAVQ